MMRGTSSVGSSRRHSGTVRCSCQPTYSRANGRSTSAGTPVASSQLPSAEEWRVTTTWGVERRPDPSAISGLIQPSIALNGSQVSSLQDTPVVFADTCSMHATSGSPNSDATPPALAAELARVEETFNRAMTSNDISLISACIADDWVLVTPEAGVVPRARILQVIKSGQLSHDTMTKDVARVKVYGDVAVVTARGRNTGSFNGRPISADEWITDVYRKVDGRWLCALTHLTPIA